MFKLPHQLKSTIHPPKGYYSEKAIIYHNRLIVLYTNAKGNKRQIDYPKSFEHSVLKSVLDELNRLKLNNDRELKKYILSDPVNAKATLNLIMADYRNGSLHLLNDNELSQLILSYPDRRMMCLCIESIFIDTGLFKPEYLDLLKICLSKEGGSILILLARGLREHLLSREFISKMTLYDKSRLNTLSQVAPKLLGTSMDSKLREMIIENEILSHLIISDILSIEQIKTLYKSELEQKSKTSDSLSHLGTLNLFQSEKKQTDNISMDILAIRAACMDTVSNLFNDIVSGKNQNSNAFQELKESCAKLDVDFALTAAKEKYCDSLIKEDNASSNKSTFFSSNVLLARLNKISDVELRNDLLSKLQTHLESPTEAKESSINRPSPKS